MNWDSTGDPGLQPARRERAGGSGSTLIAAEQTGRNAYLMELDPLYCDVIVQRWENLSGKKAEYSS